MEGRLRSNGMPPEGFANPVTSDGTGFYSNNPVSELVKRVPQVIEVGDVASTPLVAKTTNGAIVTK